MEIPPCSLGFKMMFKDAKTRIEKCDPCPDKTYQAVGNSEVTKCTDQAKCPAGQRLDALDKTKEATCVDCAAGEYQSTPGFEGTTCRPQPTCAPGFYQADNTTTARARYPALLS